MYVPKLNNAFHAIQSMIAETVSAQKVDMAKRDALMTAAEALDQELSRKLVVAGVPDALEQYRAGMITLNELGHHFILAYTYECKK